MAKLHFVFFAVLALNVCIEASSNPALYPADNKFKDARIEQAGPTLDGKPQAPSVAADSGINSQGQRQKRFYNYFSFGFSPFGLINPNYIKRDSTQDTGVYGTEDPLSQIFKRVQDILHLTRQQAFPPQTASHFPIPSFIPVFYIPQAGCGCTPDDNQGPSYDEEPDNGVPSSSTTTPTINNAPTMPPAKDNTPATPSPDNDTNNTSPDFSSRLPEMEYDDETDGVRPISFEPIQPDKPLSRPPPPVEHGSSQAGGNGEQAFEAKQDAPSTTTGPSFSQKLPPQPDLPTNAIPTLCDGAVLTCCHRTEVTYDCFMAQGCPDPSPSDNPCEANVILNVIRKFQYYYANRKISNNIALQQF